MIIYASVIERFERFAVKGEREDDCWKWSGAKDSRDGCGKLHVDRNGYPWKAYRVSWLLHFGPIPKGIEVCHVCDNRECSNPKHLFLGTHAENMADAGRKGRVGLTAGLMNNTGERNPAAKINASTVRQVRLMLSKGASQAAVARQFGLTPTHVSRIALRKLWAHISDHDSPDYLRRAAGALE
jgi:HNH endonuclease